MIQNLWAGVVSYKRYIPMQSRGTSAIIGRGSYESGMDSYEYL
jgi:hypothetical protein